MALTLALTLALILGPTTPPAQAAPGDYTGSVVAAAGDIDGDGFADYLVGSPGARFSEGRVDVYHGNATGVPTLRRSLVPSDPGDPPQYGTAFGRGLAGLGDVNGDGFDDVAIGQPLFGFTVPNGGRVWVYLGSDTGLVTERPFYILGTIPQGQFGSAVAGAGDVDGDGFRDLLVGAPYAQRAGVGVPASHGIAFLYYGSANGIVATDPVVLSGSATRQYRGFSVAGVGDVDGDGFDDVAIGAPGQDTDFVQGRVYLHRGSAAGLVAAAADSLVAGSRSGRFGAALAGVGDLDGDGRSEFVIGSPNDTSGVAVEAGRVYLRRARDGGVITELLAGTQAGAHLGSALAGGGDFDGDGRTGILVGEPDFDGALSIDEGRAHLLFANGDSTRVFGSAAALSQFGLAVAGVGDVDGDGFDDVLLGAPGTPGGGAVTLALGDGPGPGGGTQAGLVLGAPRPNPSSGGVTFRIEVQARTTVAFAIHDTRGRRVRDLGSVTIEPSLFSAITWDGRDDGGRAAPTGVYFARALAPGQVAARQFVRLP